MSDGFRRDGSGKVIGVDTSGSSGSSGGGGGGDEGSMLRIGGEANVQQAINAVAHAGAANLFASILRIKGLPETFQAFALEATMRGLSLKGILSTLSLAKPGQALGNKGQGR